MAKMTITEALAETKLIVKKVKAQEEFIANNAGRTSVMNDPLEKSGGTPAAITKAFQSIKDLQTRLVKIRTAVQSVNTTKHLVIGEKSMCIADWLNYRREVAPSYQAFLKLASMECAKLRNQFERTPQIIKLDSGEQKIIQPVFHIDLEWLRKESEVVETVLGELDGKLSLLNATTEIEV